jgi:hypothetical protein
VGELERAYFETIQPCTAVVETGGVVCDLSGWPLGMPQPDTTAVECWSSDPNNPGSALVCPTGGLLKFPRMAEQGVLKLVFQQGNTTVYEVVP